MIMKYLIIIPFLFLAIAFSTCRDAEIQPRDYAIVFTENVTDIDPKGVTFHAEMINLGQDKIIEYGFMVLNNDASNKFYFRKTYSTKAELKSSTYKTRAESDLDSGVVYLCRAFVRTNQDTIFGNKVRFTSKGSNVNVSK